MIQNFKNGKHAFTKNSQNDFACSLNNMIEQIDSESLFKTMQKEYFLI